MPKRLYIAVPTQLADQFDALAARLQLNVNQLGARCLEGCVSAIEANAPIQVPIVQHARRVLRKDTNAADRLLLNLLEKTFPGLPKNTERFRELLMEENQPNRRGVDQGAVTGRSRAGDEALERGGQAGNRSGGRDDEAAT